MPPGQTPGVRQFDQIRVDTRALRLPLFMPGPVTGFCNPFPRQNSHAFFRVIAGHFSRLGPFYGFQVETYGNLAPLF